MTSIFNKDFREYITLLNKHKVRYVLVGGMSVNLHGYNRTTEDMDIWVEPSENNFEKLKQVHIDYRMPMGEMGVLKIFLDTKTFDVFTFGGGFYRIDVMTACKGLDFEEVFNSALIHKDGEFEVRHIQLHHLIRAKKASGRQKDLADIEELEKLSGEEE